MSTNEQSIGDIGNYYGGLTVKTEDGKPTEAPHE